MWRLVSKDGIVYYVARSLSGGEIPCVQEGPESSQCNVIIEVEEEFDFEYPSFICYKDS